MTQGFLNGNLFKAKETIVNDYKAFSSATITVSGTVQLLDLTGAKANARAVHIYVDSTAASKALRYTYDGSLPSAGVGIARKDNDEFIITEFSNLQKFRVIQEVAATTTLFITYLQ
jgi:hypothetical protein